MYVNRKKVRNVRKFYNRQMMKNILKYSRQILPVGAFLLALALSVSCSDEKLGGDDNGDPKEGKEMYLSVASTSGRITGSNTRMSDGSGEDPGTIEEKHVEKVRMVLYGATDDIVKYAFDFNIRSNDEYDGFVEYEGPEAPYLYASGGSDQFTTYARKVKYDDYRMLILINPTYVAESETGTVSQSTHDLYEITAVGQPLSRYLEAVRQDYADLHNKERGGIAEDKYFLMSNHQGLIPVDKDADLKLTADAANRDPVPVEVSRAVSKVIVVTEGMLVEPSGASVAELKWDLDVRSRQTYWMRKLTYLIDEDSDAPGAMEVLRDNTKRFLQYAEDPHFEGYSASTGASDSKRAGAFLYLKDGSLSPVLGQEADQALYCLENTMVANEQNDDVLTSVVVGCRYAPVGFNIGESYFIYGKVVIPAGMMLSFVSNPETIPSSVAALNGLAEAITAAQTEDRIDFGNLDASFRSNGISYYHQGMNYYAVRIIHGGTETGRYNPGTHAYGLYGVVRNNSYKVTIQSIKGPGSSIVVQPERWNLVASIEILGWQERDQDNELE